MKRLFLVLALVMAPAAAAQTPPAVTPTPTPAPTVGPTATPAPEPTVQPGVTIAGVHVGGQTESQMRAALKVEVLPLVRRPVVLLHGPKQMTLGVGKVKQHFDLDRTAARVLKAPADTVVKPHIDFVRGPIRAFVDAYAAAVLVVPKDAGVNITLHHIGRTKARAGHRLSTSAVNRKVEKALADPTRKRRLKVRLVRTEPAVGAKDLAKRYPTIITVEQSTFTLRLFRNLHYARQYSVAVGQPAYPTPNGLFAIQSKQVNPTWTAPDSPWAGESAGQSFDASDPGNPLAARWMGVDGSVGIHGTHEDYSIGSAASHGCIRMHASDVIDLFGRVSIGTPVLIK